MTLSAPSKLENNRTMLPVDFTSQFSAANKVPTPQSKQLSVGTIMVYDFGDPKLHAYETKDPISDENFLLETPDEIIVIELIGFNKVICS